MNSPHANMFQLAEKTTSRIIHMFNSEPLGSREAIAFYVKDICCETRQEMTES